MSSYNLLTVLGGSVALVGIVILWFATRYERKVLRDHEQELKSKILQVSLLREITDRIGYTFDVMEIIEVISGSLGQLVEFSTVSYLVLDDKEQDIKVKIDVRDKVNQKFIFEVQEKMINAFSVLREESSESYTINRRVVGLVPDEEFRASLSSFFNLPLIIGGEVVGLINVASTKEGLYSAKDTEILYSITGFASSAVHRLRKLLDGEQYKMNAMVSSLANGLLMVDKDENVSVINSKAIEVLDLGNIEDIMLHNVISRTRNFFDLLDKIEQSKQSNGPVIQTDVIIKERFYNFVISPVVDSEQNMLGSVVTIQDTTAEKQLLTLREEFSAMMVHDLRAPLTALRWSVDDLLEAESLTKESITEPLELMRDASSRMLELVNDLLDVSKIEAEKFEVKVTESILKEIIEKQIKTFKPQAYGKGIKISLEYDLKIPAFPFDTTRIAQVFSNLLSNAIKFTEHGSILVSANLLQESDRVRVEVRDTGIGIPQNKLQNIFQKYVQLEAWKEGEKGTGLGLTIIKGIVEAHGGTVGVLSVEGDGSTFWFELPIR